MSGYFQTRTSNSFVLYYVSLASSLHEYRINTDATRWNKWNDHVTVFAPGIPSHNNGNGASMLPDLSYWEVIMSKS